MKLLHRGLPSMGLKMSYISKKREILNFLDFHLEDPIRIAFIWDIPEHWNRYNDKSIKTKEVLVHQDYNDGNYLSLYLMYENLAMICVCSECFKISISVIFKRNFQFMNLCFSLSKCLYQTTKCRRLGRKQDVNKYSSFFVSPTWKVGDSHIFDLLNIASSTYKIAE